MKTGADKLKKVVAHDNIDAQFAIDLSHGVVSWGQQSDISITTDISSEEVICIDSDVLLDLSPMAPPATGSIATEAAIKTANMVRAIFIHPTQWIIISGRGSDWSSDDIARLVIIKATMRRFFAAGSPLNGMP